jgi:hypothetical protein
MKPPSEGDGRPGEGLGCHIDGFMRGYADSIASSGARALRKVEGHGQLQGTIRTGPPWRLTFGITEVKPTPDNAC